MFDRILNKHLRVVLYDAIRVKKSSLKIPTLNQSDLKFHCHSLTHERPSVSHHTETSQLICSANQLIGFYMMGNIGLQLVYN